jgi:hypothetical protein
MTETIQTIELLDQTRRIVVSFADMMRYHGPGSPGGVAHAFKVLQRGLPALATDGPPERREISIRTAFAGPGARDGFELATRAVTGGRYVVDDALRRPERGHTRERFVFELHHRGRRLTLILREGYVTEEFLDLAGRLDRESSDERRLTVLKAEMADRVRSAPAAAVYDLQELPP